MFFLQIYAWPRLNFQYYQNKNYLDQTSLKFQKVHKRFVTVEHLKVCINLPIVIPFALHSCFVLFVLIDVLYYTVRSMI